MSWRGALATAAVVALVAACTAGGGSERGEQRSVPADAATSSAQRTADVGTWATWIQGEADDIAVPPPPQPGSPEAADDQASLPSTRTSAPEENSFSLETFRRWLDQVAPLFALQGKNPPLLGRAYALVSVAMYDAAVAAAQWQQVYDRPAPPAPDGAEHTAAPSYPSMDAAIAGAAARLLTYLFPERPAARFQAMAEHAAASQVAAGIAWLSDVTAGLDLGRQVGDLIVGRAESDGAATVWVGEQPPGMEFWAPPPGSAAPPTAPLAGTWRTWVLASGSAIRPDPPPAYGTGDFTAGCDEVMAVRAALSPEQEAIARYWHARPPPEIWNEIALTLIERAGLSIPHAARVLALVHVALSDAGVAAWDAKYAYWSPRPVNAIRDAGLDEDWTPLLNTPTFPSFVSGHATFSGAASEVLAHLFPDEADALRASADEAAVSRLYGGIHFRVDNDVGLRMGREGVAPLVIAWAESDGAE